MKTYFSLFLMLMVILTGCGSSGASTGAENTENTIDPNQLAKTLSEELNYDDPLSEIDTQDISLYMDIPDDATGAFYKSGGSTAEAVAVFSCENEENAVATYDALSNYLAEQKSLFEAYDAEEVARIDGAYLEQKGTLVILCVCADADAAKKLVDEAL